MASGEGAGGQPESGNGMRNRERMLAVNTLRC